MTSNQFHPSEAPTILRTQDERDLVRASSKGVQAVVFTPRAQPEWMVGLREAVIRGYIHVERTSLHAVNERQIEAFLDDAVPDGDKDTLRDDVIRPFKQDVMGLVRLGQTLTGASRFVFRILTADPSRHCGFHVDTVPPGAPTVGILRVYNGAGTDYVEPSNVTSMRDFYQFLARRERLVRDVEGANAHGGDATLADLVLLDEERRFLRRPAEVNTAPAGSIVAFKHLDVSHHWSNHDVGMAWLHCSPMAGERRLLVNITPVRQGARRPATSRGASTP